MNLGNAVERAQARCGRNAEPKSKSNGAERAAVVNGVCREACSGAETEPQNEPGSVAVVGTAVAEPQPLRR